MVSHLAFRGNYAVNSRTLLGLLAQHGGPGQRRYWRDGLEDGLMNATAAYYDRGYIEVKVGTAEETLAPDRASVALVIPVHEGHQFRIGAVKIEGAMAAPVGQYRKLLGVRTGEVFSRKKLAEGIQRVTAFQREKKAQPRAAVTPETLVHVATRRIDLTFHISAAGLREGPRGPRQAWVIAPPPLSLRGRLSRRRAAGACARARPAARGTAAPGCPGPCPATARPHPDEVGDRAGGQRAQRQGRAGHRLKRRVRSAQDRQRQHGLFRLTAWTMNTAPKPSPRSWWVHSRLTTSHLGPEAAGMSMPAASPTRSDSSRPRPRPRRRTSRPEPTAPNRPPTPPIEMMTPIVRLSPSVCRVNRM